MANTFKNYTDTAVGTSPSTSYTVAASTTAVMIGMTVANITTSQITVDVQCAGVYLVKGAAIPAGAALSVLDGKIILETTDTVVITSDTASSADAIISVLEQT
tara:strand:- start:10907 stop:11215 length:309 start_codon:yes stop_codon:yes gene_type:complete